MPRQPTYKDPMIWIAAAGLVLTVISTAIAVQQYSDAKNEAARRAEAEKAAQAALTGKGRAEDRIKQLEAEQDSMHAFLINYSAHLSDIRNALSRLDEVKTDKAETELWSAVSAFVTFVEKWRRVQPILKYLLDGIVNNLADAAAAKNRNAVEQLRLQLEKNLSDQRLLMDKEIENLKSKKP